MNRLFFFTVLLFLSCETVDKDVLDDLLIAEQISNSEYLQLFFFKDTYFGTEKITKERCMDILLKESQSDLFYNEEFGLQYVKSVEDTVVLRLNTTDSILYDSITILTFIGNELVGQDLFCQKPFLKGVRLEPNVSTYQFKIYNVLDKLSAVGIASRFNEEDKLYENLFYRIGDVSTVNATVGEEMELEHYQSRRVFDTR